MKILKNNILSLAGFLLLLTFPAFSQQYTERDQKEIAHQAQITLNMYKDLLNVISYADLATPSEITEMIRNSYTPSRNQLFYSEEAIIEDNLRPSDQKSLHGQDKTIKEYLESFDLVYEKADKETIEFYDLEVSHLKYSTYPYIKVKYTSHFKGRHTEDAAPYQAVDRIAEFRAEKRNGKWKTFISSIVYYDPANPISSEKGDVELIETQELSGSSEHGYEEVIRNAERAYNSRDYARARNFYTEALRLRPEEDQLKTKIEELERIIQNLALLKSKFSVGEHWEAISDYNKAIKKDRNNPDYYYGRGKNYEKLKVAKKALEDYTKAIQLDGHFIEALNSRARLYTETGQLHKAIADYALIISNPDYAAAYYPERAKVKLKMGEIRGAMEDYDAAIQLRPEIAELSYKKGMILFNQKKMKAAVNAFNEAIKKDPQHSPSYVQRGLAYAALEDLNKASSDFEKAREIGLEEAQLGQINKLSLQYYKKAEGAMAERSYRQALKSISEALMISPAFARAWLRKGDAHFMLEEFEKAIQDYTKAIENDPLSFGYFKRALAHQQKGDIPSSIEDFNRYLPVGMELLAQTKKENRGTKSAASLLEHFVEESADVYYTLGYAQLMTNQFVKALENLNLAIHSRKFYPKAYFARGAALYALEDYTVAVRNMEESIRMGLSEPLVFYSLGKAYIANDQIKEAVFSLSHTLELDPKYRAAYKERAYCYKRYKQYDLALQDIKVAISLAEEQKGDVELLAQKGLLELYLNNIREAKSSFEHALRLEKNNGWALYGKACALAKEGRIKESLELYRKAFQTRQLEWTSIKNDPLTEPVRHQKAFEELVKTYFL